MINKYKHNILKVLLLKYEEGEKNSGNGLTVTDLGRSMTNIDINNELKKPIKDIDRICYTLSNAGHITLYQKDDNNKAHRYLITDSGKQAFIDKIYLNKLWFRDKNNFALLLSLISILVSIYSVFKS